MLITHRGLTWICKCGKENDVNEGVCRRCKQPQGMAITEVKVSRKLTKAEENFYIHSMPALIREVRSLRQALEVLYGKSEE